jgi:hypothetical protein
MWVLLEVFIWIFAVILVLRWFHVVSRMGSEVEAYIDSHAEEIEPDSTQALPCAG